MHMNLDWNLRLSKVTVWTVSAKYKPSCFGTVPLVPVVQFRLQPLLTLANLLVRLLLQVPSSAVAHFLIGLHGLFEDLTQK